MVPNLASYLLLLISALFISSAAVEWDEYDDEELALSIPSDAVGVSAIFRKKVLEEQKRRLRLEDVESNRCYCTYSVCQNNNNTCVKHNNAACFHAIEEVYNKDEKRMETWHKYGCTRVEKGSHASHFVCNSHLVPHQNVKSIACCYEGDYCNKNIEPRVYTNFAEFDNNDSTIQLEDRPKLLLVFVIVVVVVISLIVCSLLFIFLSTKKEKQKDSFVETAAVEYFDKEEKKPMLSTVSIDEYDEDSGSGGCGKTTLIQRTIAQDLKIIKIIGRGRYGEVRQAAFRGSYVAVKTFYTTEEDSWRNERAVYQTHMINHENILQFVAADIWSEDSITQMLLVCDYHELGSLSDYLRREETLSTEEALKLIYSSICGIEHLHTAVQGTGSRRKPEIAHRDVKSKNIIVKRAGICCIADFGLAVRFEGNKLLPDKVNVQVGTKRYMAPEVLLKTLNPEDFAQFKMADMYSIALVMWEVACRVEDTRSVTQRIGRTEEESSSSGIGESLSSEGGYRVHIQKRSVDISLKAKPYVPPFEGMVGNDPSFDEMRLVVCEKMQRPPVESAWVQGNNLALSGLSQLMMECWDSLPQNRHTALKVKKEVSKLITIYDKQNRNQKSISESTNNLHKSDSGVKDS